MYKKKWLFKSKTHFFTVKSKFLVINSQINSNNSGQHTLEKFKNVNCVLINETEMRHELRDREASTKNLIISLSKKLKSKSIIVTRGNEGSIFYESQKRNFITCPAFATNISDKVGAGDAMLAVISLCMKIKMYWLFWELKNLTVPVNLSIKIYFFLKFKNIWQIW